MRAIFIGNVTIDEVGGRYRVGGSGYYGGRALTYLNVDVYVVTHIAEEYRGMIKGVANTFGINVIELSNNGIPIFIIERGKAVRFRGISPKIMFRDIEVFLKSSKFNIILFTPIMNELNSDIIDVVNYSKDVVSLDIQGFVRMNSDDSIKLQWRNNLFEIFPYMDIVHGNISEFCFHKNTKEILKTMKELSTSINTAFLISNDDKGTYLVYRGEVLHIPPPAIEPIDDVGAGDILLAITSLYRAEGMDILSSSIRGVAAASLKVMNAYREWFDRNLIDMYSREIEERVNPVELS